MQLQTIVLLSSSISVCQLLGHIPQLSCKRMSETVTFRRVTHSDIQLLTYFVGPKHCCRIVT